MWLDKKRSIDNRIDLRFRPSLIIFIDKAGRQICQHFKEIMSMTNLDEVLHQSIALLQVEEGADEAIPCPLKDDFPEDNDLPTQPGPLDELVASMLTNVRLHRRIKEIRDASYPVPDPRPQIYIVGEATSPWMAYVLRVVQQQLAALSMNTLVSYVLSAYRKVPRTVSLYTDAYDHDDPLALLGGSSYWEGRALPNFCYIYEDMRYPAHTAVSESESYYAGAEAIFTLISTGITPEPVFQRYMQINPNPVRYDNVGSMSTSLVIFPRETLLTYCSSLLGIALMQQWRRDLEDVLAEDIRRKRQRQAQKDIEDIEQWIKDIYPRPNANNRENLQRIRWYKRNKQIVEEVSKGPSLHILTLPHHPVSERAFNAQQEVHRRWRGQTATLFSLFQRENVAEEAKKRRQRPDTWTDLVYQRGGRAVETFAAWDKASLLAWQEANGRINAEIKRTIDQIWVERNKGFEQARTYIDEFDDQLARLQDQLIHLRRVHEEDYKNDLDKFEVLADGEWTILETASNLLDTTLGGGGAGQATPRMGGQSSATAQAPGSIGGPTIVGGSPPNPAGAAATYQHLPPREEQIARGLEQRVIWFQEQVPSIPTQIAISIPFLLAIVLFILAIFPALPFLVDGGITVLCAIVIALGNWAFWWRYQKKVEIAREYLLKFYRRHYAYKCEKREDDYRVILIAPFRLRVLAIREKLDDLHTFITDIQNGLHEQATDVQRNFFNSPSGGRDVFVANGERLQRSRRNTIEQFAVQVNVKRMKEPLEEWHRTPQDIKEVLIESFQHLPESIIEMDDEHARQHIYQFTRGIIAQYLCGDLTNIRFALDKEDVWHEVLDQVQNSLYRAQVGAHEADLKFVCGREPDIVIGAPHLPEGTRAVLLSDHHDWLLVAAFFRGGSPLAIDADILFPKLVSSAPIDDTSRSS